MHQEQGIARVHSHVRNSLLVVHNGHCFMKFLARGANIIIITLLIPRAEVANIICMLSAALYSQESHNKESFTTQANSHDYAWPSSILLYTLYRGGRATCHAA